jgi:hypothetical protein
MLSKISLKRYLEICVMVIISLTILIYVNRVARQLFVKGQGKRMGVVTKITKRGWFNQSWEGELFVPSEEVSEGVMYPEVWNFSVSDENVVTNLEKLIGKNVIVRYNREFEPLKRETLFDVIYVTTNDVPQIFVTTQDDLMRYPRFVPIPSKTN